MKTLSFGIGVLKSVNFVLSKITPPYYRQAPASRGGEPRGVHPPQQLQPRIHHHLPVTSPTDTSQIPQGKLIETLVFTIKSRSLLPPIPSSSHSNDPKIIWDSADNWACHGWWGCNSTNMFCFWARCMKTKVRQIPLPVASACIVQGACTVLPQFWW